MAPSWSETFNVWRDKEGLSQLAVAHRLKVAPSRVHAWCHGAVPREKMRKRIERVSDGAVPAASAPASGTSLPTDATGTDG